MNKLYLSQSIIRSSLKIGKLTPTCIKVTAASSGVRTQSFSTDQRYQPVNEVPESVLESMNSAKIHSPGFSIKGEALQGRPAYLDFQATTPLDPRVLDAMMPFLTEKFGNPHSKTHSFGWESEQAIDQARENIANLIGASSKEIIFTSGATESNNMSIKGVARFYKEHKNHIITTQTEHKCVLDSCRSLEAEGFTVTYLPVQSNGLISLEELEKAMRPETALVSVMGVNNEIGVVQPLKEIGQVTLTLTLINPSHITLTSSSYCIIYSSVANVRYSSTLISRRWQANYPLMWTTCTLTWPRSRHTRCMDPRAWAHCIFVANHE